MAQLGKTYEPVCSEDGKENLNQVRRTINFSSCKTFSIMGKNIVGKQPYMWLGVEDPSGSGVWRRRKTRRLGEEEEEEEDDEEGGGKAENSELIHYTNWDADEGSEGDTCARMLGNGANK